MIFEIPHIERFFLNSKSIMKNKEIQLKDIWNDKRKEGLKEFIASHSTKQSKEQCC